MLLKKTPILSAALSFLLFSPALSATTRPNQGVFTSVSGSVTVLHGGKASPAQKDSTVLEGDQVSTDKDSTATLSFFDGSELNVKPGTQFNIGKLRKSGTSDKIFQFKLALGKLFATVKKLASSKSSFEIDAGGVICGVRGTQYEVDYDPNRHLVDIFVKEGNVWAKAGGQTYQYGPGNEGHFTGGKPNNPNIGNGQVNKGKGNMPAGSPNQPPGPPDSFSPFYGMGGNQGDPFKPLTGGAPDTGNAANKAGDDQFLGLGAHTLIIQFKMPEI